MSPHNRALLSLGTILAIIALFSLLGAAAPAPSVPLRDNPALLQALTPSATAAPLAATPIPLTPTLARREFNESAALTVKVAPTSFLPGRGPQLPGQLVESSRRLDFYVGGGTFTPEEVQAMAVGAERALSYMQKRFATTLSQRVSVGVYSVGLAPGRGTRGIAYTYGETNVRIYYQPGEDSHNALVVLSHELGHALQAEAYGKEAQSRSDLVLLEGLASWISGEYWLSLSESPSFHERARNLYQAGYRGSLAGLGRGDLNTAYDMWAAFVDYLTRTYGWDAFNQLYRTGRGRAAGSADYQGIYGKSFGELQAEFYATLE